MLNRRRLARWAIYFVAGVVPGGLLAAVALVYPSRDAARAASRCGGCGSAPGPAVPAAPEEGHEKLGPPKPGEWLYRFKEDGQTFEEYVRECVNQRCAHRTTFYLQPLGAAGERYGKTIERMREYAEAFFGVPAKVAPALPMFEDAHARERGQYLATKVIGHLAGRVPADGLVYIGITEKDLYSKGLNFVFGEGSLARRTGVYSLTRYETEDPTLFLRRALKLMAHEVGHILSIEHCIYWRCVMQGANSLAEDDAHPMHLCPVDLRKLQWNTGFDRDERYRSLLDFYGKNGLEEEAAWVAARLER